MKARVLVTTPYEILQAVERQCARCGQMEDSHAAGCIELFLQATLRELLNTSPELENGEIQ